VSFNINGKEFESKFTKMFRAIEREFAMLRTDFERLSTFQPNPKFFGFPVWISEIELGCDEFYPDFEPQDQVEFGFARDEENF